MVYCKLVFTRLYGRYRRVIFATRHSGIIILIMKKSNITITILGLILFLAAAVAGLVRSEIWTSTGSELIVTGILVVLGIIGIGYFAISSIKKKFRYASILRKKYGTAYFCQVEYDIQNSYVLTVDKETLRLFTADKKMTEIWSSSKAATHASIVDISINGIRKGKGLQLTAAESSSSTELLQQLRLVMLDDSKFVTPVIKDEALESILKSIQ